MDESTLETAYEPEDWLLASEALRRVARDLVRDPSRADDVVQNAYLTALEQPPVRLTVAWLHRVVRSRAFDALRRDRRRREAPLEAAGAPEAPDFTRQLELHRVLVDAVNELSEPYKGVVYMRYFEGLAPAEIASELDVPVKTVKTRLHRALGQLRERLRRDFGQDRWSSAVIATFGLGSKNALDWLRTAIVAGGVGIMVKKIVVTAFVLALAAWGVSEWKPWHGGTSRARVPEVAMHAGAELETPPAPDKLTPAPTTAGERNPTRAESIVETPAAPAATGTLVVHTTWSDGTPAAGVAIHLRAGGDGRGLPPVGIGRERCDVDGVARFEGLAPGTGMVGADRYSETNTRAFEVRAGEERTVRFQLGGGIDVRGVVRDAKGATVAGASVWLTTGFGGWLGGHVVATSGSDGGFEVRDAPPVQSLGAFAEGHGRSKLVDLERLDTSTEPVRVEIALTTDGGRLEGNVTGPDGEPVAGALVTLGEVADTDWSVNHTTEHWSPRTALTDGNGNYAMVGLPVGDLPLRARANGLPIWKGDAVIEAGHATRADITLAAGAIVEGTVLDAQHEPVAGAIVRAFDEAIPLDFIQFGQYDYEDTFGHLAATSDADGRYQLTCVPPGDVFLYANPERDRRGYHVKGLMRAEDVLHAEPGDRLVWDPVLTEGHVIDGIVTYRDGAPMENVYISARNDATGVAQSIRSDTDGTFLFVNMDDAPYVLGVQLWDAPEGADPVDARDVWPDRGRVELIASYDKPVELETATVRCTIDDAGRRAPSLEQFSPMLESDGTTTWVGFERDGDEFVFPSVKPGRYRPVLAVAESPVYVGAWIELSPGEDYDLGVLRTAPAGSVRVKLDRPPGTEDVEVRIFIRPEGVMNARRVDLGTASEVLLENLTGGLQTASVYGSGMMSIYAEVTAVEKEEVELRLELVPAVRRALEITWPENEALGELTVRVEDALGGVPWESTQPNVAFLDRPYTQSPNLPVGTFTVTAESKSGLLGSVQFEVASLAPDQPAVKVEMR